MTRQELIYPVRMLLKLCDSAHIFSFYEAFGEFFQLVFQTRRQNRKSHNLNEADVLFFDVMILCMRMVNTERAFVRRDVVAQCQIEFERITHFSCDRGDRVVRLSVGLGKYKRIFICVASPAVQNMLCQIDQPFLIFVTDPDDGQRPFDDAGFHILVSFDGKMALNRRFAIANV